MMTIRVDGHGPEGRLRPPYGGARRCAAVNCGRQELNETVGAFLHRDRNTGKLMVLCGDCSILAQIHAPLAYPLIAL